MTDQPKPSQSDSTDHAIREDALRWRKLVAASEMEFPIATIAEDPENDCVLLYGKRRLEDLIDRFDEIPGFDYEQFSALSQSPVSICCKHISDIDLLLHEPEVNVAKAHELIHDLANVFETFSSASRSSVAACTVVFSNTEIIPWKCPRCGEVFTHELAAIAHLEKHPPRSNSDEVFEALGLEPDRFRSEGGSVNKGKLRAAILHPADYLPSDHWLQERASASQNPLATGTVASQNSGDLA